MNNCRFQNVRLSDLSTYRTQLMGIAALMIIICHANTYHVLLPNFLASLLRWGNLGVDIFLFLSGIGLYYSLNRRQLCTRSDYISFYKRRFTRILIPYWMVYLPACIFFMIMGMYSFGDSLLCLSTIEYWLFHRGAWFVSMILVLYLAAPVLYKTISTDNKWVIAAGIIVALTILCNIPVNDHSSDSILYNMQWAFNRVPSFILGITIGSSCKNGKQIPPSQILLFSLSGIIMSVSIGVWKCLWLIIPTILYFLIILIKLLENTRIDNGLKFLGEISLESYLTNITLKLILGALIPSYFSSPVFIGHYLDYAAVIVLGILIAKKIHIISKKITTDLFPVQTGK